MQSCTPENHQLLIETWATAIQTVALVASAIAGIWLILAGRRGEKRRATIDLVLEQGKDADIKAAKDVLYDLHKNQTQNFAAFLNDRNGTQYISIMIVLNNYEFIAAGVREDAIDEELYKRMQYTVLMKDWTAIEPFLIELRRLDKHPTLFQEFELLARKWKKDPLKCEVNK